MQQKLIFKVNQVFNNRGQRGFFLFRKISISILTPENRKTKKKKNHKVLTTSKPLNHCAVSQDIHSLYQKLMELMVVKAMRKNKFGY